MQRRWIAIFALVCICIPSITPIVSNASGEDEIYKPGYVRWEGNELHRIYLSGTENNVNLTRDYQGASMGNVQITTGQSASIGPLSMPPLEMGANYLWIKDSKMIYYWKLHPMETITIYCLSN